MNESSFTRLNIVSTWARCRHHHLVPILITVAWILGQLPRGLAEPVLTLMSCIVLVDEAMLWSDNTPLMRGAALMAIQRVLNGR